MATLVDIPNAVDTVSGLRLERAEMVLWLPGRPVVRRELLGFNHEDRRFDLRPDESPAGLTLRVRSDRFHAMLSGPERADLEVDFVVHAPEGVMVPMWGLVHGRNAEVSVWDAMGRLAVPDLTARGADAGPLRLDRGRYVVNASAIGSTTLVLGVGCDLETACLDLGGLRAAAG